MKVHIDVDVDVGRGAQRGGLSDQHHSRALVCGERSDVFADLGYRGVSKCEEMQSIDAIWQTQGRGQVHADRRTRARDRAGEAGSEP